MQAADEPAGCDSDSYILNWETAVKLRLASLLILTCMIAAAQIKDYAGNKDPALLTRMLHYFLPARVSVVETLFDAFEFTVKNGTQRLERRHLHYTYDIDESAGFLQIVRNYEALAKKLAARFPRPTSAAPPSASPKRARRPG